MMGEGRGGAATGTKPRKLAWDTSRGLDCQTWELELYDIGRKHLTNITELCFGKIELTSVYGIVYIRSCLLFLTQVLILKYLSHPHSYAKLSSWTKSATYTLSLKNGLYNGSTREISGK